MARSDRDLRVSRLTEAAQARSADAMARARRAILALRSRGERVTPTTVAAEAGVSVSFLAKHVELRDEIRALMRESRPPIKSSRPATSTSTLDSVTTKLAVVTDRLRELETDNRRLRDENAALRGEVLELRRATRRSEV